MLFKFVNNCCRNKENSLYIRKEVAGLNHSKEDPDCILRKKVVDTSGESEICITEHLYEYVRQRSAKTLKL